MGSSENHQDFLYSESVTSRVVFLVERVVHYHWVLTNLEYVVEYLTVQLGAGGVEEVAVVVQELSQVLWH